jgi:hypothetical protein
MRTTGNLGRPDLDHCAISVPLTSVTKGLSRLLADRPPRRSGHVTARMAQIPKLIVKTSLSAHGLACSPAQTHVLVALGLALHWP